MQALPGLNGVDREAVGRNRAIVGHMASGVETRRQLRWRIVVTWRAGANQPEVIEESASERGMKEPVREGVFQSQSEQRQRMTVEVTHRQPADARDRDEAVHPAIVDLFLLLIETMHRVTGTISQIDIAIRAEGTVWQPRVEAC